LANAPCSAITVKTARDSIEVKDFPDLTVCVVADGMGGQAASEIASKKAIEIIPLF